MRRMDSAAQPFAVGDLHSRGDDHAPAQRRGTAPTSGWCGRWRFNHTHDGPDAGNGPGQADVLQGCQRLARGCHGHPELPDDLPGRGQRVAGSQFAVLDTTAQLGSDPQVGRDGRGLRAGHKTGSFRRPS